MASRRPVSPAPAKHKPASSTSTKAAARNTASRPAKPDRDDSDRAAKLAADTDSLVARRPFNANKPGEYGDAATEPAMGEHVEPPSRDVGASTLSEDNVSAKTGAPAEAGANPTTGPLARVRVDATGQALTTNQGVPIGTNQDSLKAGLRGPTLLEDFILREKITHFDHERIPERVVHARGSAAHGYFECYAPLKKLTRASVFSEAGKITPVFVRFSTVAGERGSTDTARDARGFAVKFYTDEGNWDLVGNNIPVFFIQDAMKFPDLVHAVKPEPHHGMPQAASAHDTFWDFVSLMPESTHMLLWVMSDRAIPRSYRTMQGFGVHSFRFVNEAGESVFCKFHWTPKQGTHSLVWDEAVRISGADPDFHRRDLWESIEGGDYPEWELGVQTFTEEQADKFSFDVLDATKIVPEELVPVKPVGRMVLNRNPDNFFAETEQVAFCTAHIVPGIDFSNDPLLAGRIHSYVDTQITRLGGPNFHEIPINSPIAPVHNNQRDGLHRQAIHRGRVAYEPNSLGAGCPHQMGAKGFASFAEKLQKARAPADKVRGRPEKFAEHYAQAALFYESQTPVEQGHIVGAFRFELSKVTVPAIRARMIASLRNVSEDLAERLTQGLGMELPDPMPRAIERVPRPEVRKSPSLSLRARPGETGVKGLKVALLVADGVESRSLKHVQEALFEAGALPRLVGVNLGSSSGDDGASWAPDATLENTPAVLFDALVLPAGRETIDTLRASAHTSEFIRLQYRHCKTILALGNARELLSGEGIEMELAPGQLDPGLVAGDSKDVAALTPKFLKALARQRHDERDRDPPRI